MPTDYQSGKGFEALRLRLRNFGRSRFPALREEVDDLVSQALTDLLEYLKHRPSDQAIDADTIQRVAFSIFKRRAVDSFRERARLWAQGSEQWPTSERVDPRTNNDVQTDLHKRMLRVCMIELAKAPESDRSLIALVMGIGPNSERSMSARDRQRLHRLRLRLIEAIRRTLGEDVAKQLRE